MKATLEKIENNVANLEIEVPEPDVSKAIDQEYRKLAQKIRVPGFRKGKVPRKVLELRFGKELFYKGVLESLLPRVYAEALEEVNLEPIDEPKIDVVDRMEEGKPLRLKATVPIKPEVKLGNYREIRVQRKPVTVKDEEVDQNLESLREQRSWFVDLERDIVEKGDFVSIDTIGYMDGNPIENSSVKGGIFRVGEGILVPEIEEALLGARVGEEIEVEVAFPEDYRDEKLAGKKGLFKVAVRRIMAKELPPLDDEFARAMGNFNNMEELRAEVKERLERLARAQEEARLREEIIDKVVELSEVDVPQVMVEREIDAKVAEFRSRLEERKASFEGYLEALGMDEEAFRNTFREEAERRVRRDLVVEAVGKAEGIVASEEEIGAEVERLLARYEGSKDKDRALEILERAGGRRQIRSAIIKEKTLDFLVKMCSEEPEVDGGGEGGDVQRNDMATK